METSSHDLSNPYRKYGRGDLSPWPIFATFPEYLQIF